ncbi:type II toxin-antitoxin system RelE/ParE family toxin [Formosa sp. PL04]|uniref:type II toxin-antitoxin system RelE/ParE family toxin n=1 Tax=Formosa sp. PL04 TaxID=3081755 RepID=UPI00298218B7|nr:type II toxin-antitoxin system RelE/ParE family toxin [Formosa sp. PL04]MDW5287957.1 type II toxin-antitoxin system RelE/ParE family toxin [Formosa sp. PL04]
MNREIIISKTAEKKLESLFKYLIDNWSVSAKNEFIKKLDSSLENIKAQPELFPESKKGKGLRKCVITKQTTLYYRFTSSQINVVTIFDTRQNPKKLRKET